MNKHFQFSIRQMLWVTASFCVAAGMFAAISASMERDRVTLPLTPFAFVSASVGLLLAAFACPTWKSRDIVIGLAAAMFVLTLFVSLVYMVLTSI